MAPFDGLKSCEIEISFEDGGSIGIYKTFKGSVELSSLLISELHDRTRKFRIFVAKICRHIPPEMFWKDIGWGILRYDRHNTSIYAILLLILEAYKNCKPIGILGKPIGVDTAIL